MRFSLVASLREWTWTSPDSAGFYILRVKIWKKPIVILQGLWASKTVKLAPEPPGLRCGTVGEEYAQPPLTLIAVGDSLVAGSGVTQQSDGLIPATAQKMADKLQRPVYWQTHSRLGSTMRRVRYRFLPEVGDQIDFLLVCAGSNDVMARRSAAEWEDDVTAVLQEAQRKATTVFMCSAGQPHNCPALPKTLREALGRAIDRQTGISVRLCKRHGVPFANVAHADLPKGFWADDGFHPSQVGYKFAADKLVQTLDEAGKL